MKHSIIILGIFYCSMLSSTSKKEIPHIRITNTIKPQMLKYKFNRWISYSPDSFEVTVNGKSIKPGESITVPQDKELPIRYGYSFAKGFRTGTKEVTFKFDTQAKESELTFSWDDKHRLNASNARVSKFEVIQ